MAQMNKAMRAGHKSMTPDAPKKHEADMCPKSGKKCADESMMKRGYK